jgi:hypothetical protein
LFRRALLAVLLCAAPAWAAGAQDGRQAAAELAADNGWQLYRTRAAGFLLTTYSRIDEPGNPSLVVYIEGDGYPWKTRTELSDDPTPTHPRTLELALEDPAPNKVYIARPCQYLDAAELASCPSEFWSFSRYAPQVIDAVNLVITRFVGGTGARHVRLVGYSGGGLIAALIVERRDDVEELVTVAANLDHKAWTDLQGVTPLEGSLNAADVAAQIEHVPQIHFVGADDTNVPLSVVEAYVARMDDTSSTEIAVVDGMSHNCCWTEVWPDLLAAHGIGGD